GFPAATAMATGAGLPANPLSGIITTNGNITLRTTDFGQITLNAPVNANAGSTTLGSSPGTVFLFAADDLSQNSSGIIVAGALTAESDNGDVTLTAANRIGANDVLGVATTAGQLAGGAAGDFSFVNSNAGIDVTTISCGCSGIATDFGDIKLK